MRRTATLLPQRPDPDRRSHHHRTGHRLPLLLTAITSLLVGSLALAPPANASGTVSYDANANVITYLGTAGPDRVRVDTSVTRCAAGETCIRIISESGAISSLAGDGCTFVSPEHLVVRCILSKPVAVRIRTGEGDDVYTTDPRNLIRENFTSLVVLAEGGNDTLTGGGAPETLDGGDGNDLIIPDAGVSANSVGPDTIIGGAGLDTLDYRPSFAAASGVTIDLGIAGADGTTLPGDVDNVTDTFETYHLTPGNDTFKAPPQSTIGQTVYGYAGNDTIDTGGGDDTIDADTGDDTIFGGAGNDSLVPGPGRDIVFGDTPADPNAAGDDQMVLQDGVADEVTCGPGNDRAEADPIDIFNDTCETVISTAPPPPVLDANLTLARPTLNANKSRRKARVALACAGGLPCAGTLLLKTTGKSRRLIGQRQLGKGTYAIAKDASGTATVKLNRKARKLLRMTKRAKVQVQITVQATRAVVRGNLTLIR